MIYIVGFVFDFNVRTQTANVNAPIQERIAMARRDMGQRKPSMYFDSRFVVGDTYRVARIYKVVEDEIPKVKYLFSNLTDQMQPDIDITLPDTTAGDDYIAAISGRTLQLSEERKHIVAMATDSDI